MTASYDELLEEAAKLESYGDQRRALEHYYHALEMRPNSPALLGKCITACLATGRSKVAAQSLRKYLELDPGNTKAALLLVKLSFSEGVEIDPDFVKQTLQSVIRGTFGAPMRAIRRKFERHTAGAVKRGLSLKGLTRGQANAVRDARLHHAARRLSEADRALGMLPESAETHPAVLEIRGQILAAKNLPEKAIDLYEQALTLAPSSLQLISKILITEVRAGRYASASERLNQLPPEMRASDEIAFAEAMLLGETGKSAEALEILARLEQLPDRTGRIAEFKARTLNGMGRFEEADARLETVARLRPLSAAPFNIAAVSRRLKPGSDLFDRAEGLVRNPEASQEDRAGATFAIAKALQSAGDHEAAFRRFEQANGLIDRQYDPGGQEDFARTQMEIFGPEMLSRATDLDRGKGMVFIVGLPRSGSTLTSQILASHPEAISVGEYQRIHACRRAAIEAGYPERTAEFPAAMFARLADMYLRELPEAARDARFVIDKELTSSLHLGLQTLMFPGARFIHTRRDPVDGCFSIYCHWFAGAFPYAYRQETLAHFHQMHEALMAHWHDVLPGRLYTCQYEELVAEPEVQTRRLLEAAGMDFHPDCLEFHQAKRAPNTSSVYQVRQPINASSIGGWRRHADGLETLRQGLQKPLHIEPRRDAEGRADDLSRAAS